jgi:5-(carboxyamino)imidazole ribonucleotide synthase
LYGKTTCSPMRKMGHITVMNADITEAKRIAQLVNTTLVVRGTQAI